MGKQRNASKPTRADKVEENFKAAPPLEPKNKIQTHYINLINGSPITFATGYPGTSKTYIPTRIASLWLKQKAIQKIILLRPAVSASKSVGYAKGTHEEKMKHWLRPILKPLREEFSFGQLRDLMKEEVQRIDFCPLENVKGNSWDNAFVIVDEAEDCTLEEIIALTTRIGKNTTLVICGDVAQSDLTHSGLGQFLDMRKQSKHLTEATSHIDFDELNFIVRSDICRKVVTGLCEIGFYK
ncbi:MAG: PhoH family protein [Neptuniibacter sp.]